MVEERLVWMDLEMTGLEPEENTIIEIATIVTAGDLTVVAEGPAFAISQPESELAKMTIGISHTIPRMDFWIEAGTMEFRWPRPRR